METPSGAVFPPYLIHHKQVLPSQISSGREVFFVYALHPMDMCLISDKIDPLMSLFGVRNPEIWS